MRGEPLTTTRRRSPLQFASPEWVDRIEELLAEVVDQHRDQLTEEPWTFSQTFTGVPPNGTTTSWGAVVSRSGIEFHRNAIDATLGIKGTYEAILPIARFEFGTATPDDLTALLTHWQSATAAGQIDNVGDVFTHLLAGGPQATVFIALHDAQARELDKP